MTSQLILHYQYHVRPKKILKFKYTRSQEPTTYNVSLHSRQQQCVAMEQASGPAASQTLRDRLPVQGIIGEGLVEDLIAQGVNSFGGNPLVDR